MLADAWRAYRGIARTLPLMRRTADEEQYARLVGELAADLIVEVVASVEFFRRVSRWGRYDALPPDVAMLLWSLGDGLQWLAAVEHGHELAVAQRRLLTVAELEQLTTPDVHAWLARQGQPLT